MATACGKAARRRWGTKANAKRAHRHKTKEFGSSEAEKAAYRELKRKQKRRKKSK